MKFLTVLGEGARIRFVFETILVFKEADVKRPRAFPYVAIGAL